MASVVGICNRALQKLGAGSISALNDDDPRARACTLSYQEILEAELRAHPWSFAIRRFSLAANAIAPTFGKAVAFDLPPEFICLLPPDDVQSMSEVDWQIEGDQILTNDLAPLEIRAVCLVSDPNLMDALFREVLAIAMAKDMCETITQSNTKKASLDADYKEAIAKAKRANAIERPSLQAPIDTFISVRN